MAPIPRHKVFISFHEDDVKYKNQFVRMMGGRTVDRSVKVGNIDDSNIKTATIRQRIRDDFIRDASVTIVLIGLETWQRKHVDWEIGSSIRKTKRNPRCGLIGILLPNHPNYRSKRINPRLIPPRLADNNFTDGFARVYRWPSPWTPAKVAQWIHEAYVRSEAILPDNVRPQFGRNRTTDPRKGWQGALRSGGKRKRPS